jgi:hypothetical protein
MAESSTELRNIWLAGRPLVETHLDTAVQMAALRDTATNAGFDWSQIKALLTATIRDEEDGKGRVEALLNKAGACEAYADMLGLTKVTENKYSGDSDRKTGEIVEKPASVPPARFEISVAPEADDGRDALLAESLAGMATLRAGA